MKVKSFLKNTIVHILASKPISSIGEKVTTAGIPVFMFHRFRSDKECVDGHDPEYLDRCLSYLTKEGYTFVSLEDIIDSLANIKNLPARSVAFTMDDGFLDQATVAAPIFIKHKCPVTVFLISDFLDNKLWPWDDQVAFCIKNTTKDNVEIKLDNHKKTFELYDQVQKKNCIHFIQNWIKDLDATNMGDYLQALSTACKIKIPKTAPQQYQAMNWEHARDLEKKGITFAPHTTSHRILSQLDDKSASYEISHSWERLKQELNSPSPVFCYPTGRECDFTHREINYIKDAGLKAAVSTEATFIHTTNTHENYLYKLPRFSFTDSFTDFIQYSSWIERAKTRLLRR